jgi:hypothetical protein
MVVGTYMLDMRSLLIEGKANLKTRGGIFNKKIDAVRFIISESSTSKEENCTNENDQKDYAAIYLFNAHLPHSSL